MHSRIAPLITTAFHQQFLCQPKATEIYGFHFSQASMEKQHVLSNVKPNDLKCLGPRQVSPTPSPNARLIADVLKFCDEIHNCLCFYALAAVTVHQVDQVHHPTYTLAMQSCDCWYPSEFSSLSCFSDGPQTVTNLFRGDPAFGALR